MSAGKPATYQHRDGIDLLTVGPRHRRPVTDELLLSIQHRTIGDPRAVVMDRAAVAELHAWLGWWLENGWPGVRRTGERPA